MVAPELVLDWVRAHPLPGGRIIPVCLWGPRGVGKTAAIGAYAKQRNLGFRSYIPSHDTQGSDIVGLARIDNAIDRTVYARPMWLPAENDAVVFQAQGVLFVDELNRAPKSVLRGLMEPLGEGRIEHSGWKLPAGWGFVCAANPPEPGYDVEVLDEALMNRLLHIPMGFDAVRWAAWAGGHDVHPDLVGFTAAFHTEVIAEAEPRLPESLSILATPRTVEYMARLYEPDMDGELLHVLAYGLMGPAAGKQFIEYLQQDQRPVTAEEVLHGRFAERLAAHRADGRADLLDASATLVLAMLMRYSPTDAAVGRVAQWLGALGPERVPAVWAQIALQAPHWTQPLHAAWKSLGAG